MLILLPVADITVINHFLNQLLHSQKGVYLLNLYKSLNLAYISPKSRLIDLLDILLLFI